MLGVAEHRLQTHFVCWFFLRRFKKWFVIASFSMGHARALLGSPDRVYQEKIAKQAVAEAWSVRAVEEAIRAVSEDEIDLTKREKRTPLRAPGLIELESLLGDYLNTRVNISMGSDKGKIAIDFSTLEDLERIYFLMASANAEVNA